MDLVSLIAKAPALSTQLLELDLDRSSIIQIGGELNRQLRSRCGPDITDLLSRLDMQGFLAMVDVDQLSRATEVDMLRAESTVLVFGKVVEAFQGQSDTIKADCVTKIIRPR